ncbi:L-rhamnose mutarotase [Nakamurella silvestris]|nr:L-rhamnose mutarotase [Nakamurella silvestris]
MGRDQLNTSPADDQFCFVYDLADGAGPEYEALHRQVPPGVQRALSAGGAYDYSIFRRNDLVISVLRAHRGLAAIERATAIEPKQPAWAASLAPLFARTTDENGLPLFAHRVFRLP